MSPVPVQKLNQPKDNDGVALKRNAEPLAIVLANQTKTKPSVVISPDQLPSDIIVKNKLNNVPVLIKTEKPVKPLWEEVPTLNLSQLGQHYLMLSKFRLTCKCVLYI